MIAKLPFFNFSIKKVLEREPDSFERAKVKIITTILVFTLAKALIVFGCGILQHDHRQMLHSGIVLILFFSLFKILLGRPNAIKIVSHAILIFSLFGIYANIFLLAQGINMISVQLVFMTALCSYYLIGGRMASFYTALAIFPVLFYMLARQFQASFLPITPEQLPPLGRDVIVMLNFITFVISHYLYYRAFHQNLKEKEALNKQLQVNVIEAKALAESRAVFLSTMSHELRTPLTGVIGITNLLKDNAQPDQKEYLNMLEFSATNLLAMINDVLDYNKSEADKIELEALPVNLPVLLKKISSGIEIKAVEKRISWKLEIDEALKNRQVITDPTRLSQIIYNLAGNAVKFTHRGWVALSATVLTQNEYDIQVRFSISDTGIGISTDRQEAIFELFTQASPDTTRKYGGTGLGLSIVKRLLKLFGSEIRVESQPQKGSVFSFDISFPIAHGQANSVEPKAEKNNMKGLRLLIGEDNHINALILKKILSKWDIETVVAIDGEGVLSKVSSERFDGVLMDIHMPVMDGYAAASAIRALPDPTKANIPIIALTASVSGNIFNKVQKAGMQDYLMKPFQPELLHEKLQQFYKRETA